MARPSKTFTVIRWAFGLGIIGLIAGTALQLLYMPPRIAQTPLLGAFVTGPLGLVIGAIFGYFSRQKSRYEE